MTDRELATMTQRISKLMRVPVRYYDDEGTLLGLYSPVALETDPFQLYLNRLSDQRQHMTLMVTDDNITYGIINATNNSVVIGPVTDEFISSEHIRELAHTLEVSKSDIPVFTAQIQKLEQHSVLSLLSVMCYVNDRLNHGKPPITSEISLEELQLYDLYSPIAFEEINFCDTNGEQTTTARYLIEETMYHIIQEGDLARLDIWLRNLPVNRTLIPTTGDKFTDLKIRFVINTTLAYRASVAGGCNAKEMVTIQHDYIAKAFAAEDEDTLAFLHQNMLTDFVRRVAAHNQDNQSRLVVDATNYIKGHLGDCIKTEDIADALYISRSYLSTRFNKETGMKLSAFIRKQKIHEAKRLLKYSDYPLSQISELLGFSSQSHLTRVFKLEVGMTPFDYRREVKRL